MTHHQTQVLAYFAQKQIHLSQRYIASLLTTFTIAPPPPILPAATLSTFYTAFLNSTLQQSASPQSFLPRSLANQHNTTVSGSTLVQVIHVQDIGTSRLAQLEAVEKALNEAGPQGRRVIDLPVEEEGDDANAQNNPQNEVNEEISVGKSICKLLLEDGKGERVYGMEVKPIEGIKVGMSLGCKLVLRNVPVLRGVLQLRPTNTTVLGGRIEALDQGYFPTRWKQEMETEINEIKNGLNAQNT